MRTTQILPAAAALSALLAIAAAGAAEAQYGPPPPPGYGGGYGPGPYGPPPPPPEDAVLREGFVGGFSLGAGSFTIGCDGCGDGETYDGFGFAFHLGGMISPRTALLVDGWALVHPLEGGGDVTHAIGTLALQMFVGPKLWLKGGLGFGQLTEHDEDGNLVAESPDGFAGMGALGYELWQRPNFSVDVQLRLAAIAYEDERSGEQAGVFMSEIGVGLNWW